MIAHDFPARLFPVCCVRARAAQSSRISSTRATCPSPTTARCRATARSHSPSRPRSDRLRLRGGLHTRSARPPAALCHSVHSLHSVRLCGSQLCVRAQRWQPTRTHCLDTISTLHGGGAAAAVQVKISSEVTDGTMPIGFVGQTEVPLHASSRLSFSQQKATQQVTFTAPSLLKYKFSVSAGDACALFYPIPVARGRSRVLVRRGRNFATARVMSRAALVAKHLENVTDTHMPRPGTARCALRCAHEAASARVPQSLGLSWRLGTHTLPCPCRAAALLRSHTPSTSRVLLAYISTFASRRRLHRISSSTRTWPSFVGRSPGYRRYTPTAGAAHGGRAAATTARAAATRGRRRAM